MKRMLGLLVLSVLSVLMFPPVHAQQLLLWEDSQQILSANAEKALFKELAQQEVEVVMTMNYSKRCEYLFGEIRKQGGQAVITILDCERRVVGNKTFTNRFFNLDDDQKVIRVSMAIVDIIEERPGPKSAQTNAERDGDATSSEDYEKFVDGEFSVPFNHHTSRYFFSPSSYNLYKGELYYSTLYFMAHDIQYGITDKFSVGMGTTVALLPFYITPKYSFKIDDKNSMSVGTLLGLGTWGVDLFGNLAYGTYTRGDQFTNYTVGLGHLYLEADGDSRNQFVGNLSAMARISDYIYFVTENYYTNMAQKEYAYYYGVPPNEWGWWENAWEFRESYTRSAHYVAGMSGFRFVNKSKNVNAFQFGLTYVFRVVDPIPQKYNSNLWDTQTGRDWRRFIIPTVSFVAKLGKRV
jgi:hypothetical protein